VVIDSSAILAIVYAEPEEATFLDLIAKSENRLLSSPSYVEISIVLDTRHGEQGVKNLQSVNRRIINCYSTVQSRTFPLLHHTASGKAPRILLNQSIKFSNCLLALRTPNPRTVTLPGE